VRRRGPLFQPSVIVAATGNESDRPRFKVSVAPPAAASDFIAVGAVGPSDGALRVAAFSNTSPQLCAPGVDILSARAGGGLTTMSGTSMATPHVAGVAALWADRLIRTTGKYDARTLEGRMIGNCDLDRLGADVDPTDYGAGLVRAPLK